MSGDKKKVDAPDTDVQETDLEKLQKANDAKDLEIQGLKDEVAKGADLAETVKGMQKREEEQILKSFNKVAEGYKVLTGEDEVPYIHPTRIVTPGYFETMGIPVVAGRSFDWRDMEETARTAIVSEAFAEKYWPGQDVLGKRLRSFLDQGWFSIVGVVGGVRAEGLDEDPIEALYYPPVLVDGASFFRAMTLAIRTEGAPMALLDPVRRQIRDRDRYLPIANVRTMQSYLSGSMARATFTMLMLVIAACSALVLGAVGIYGVIAYVVSLRTQEIGIRMALGARRRDVRQMVLRQGGVVVLSGIGVGLVGAFALTRLMGSMLFEISPFDATTFLATPVLLALVALVACFLPARRAAAVSPSVALRAE